MSNVGGLKDSGFGKFAGVEGLRALCLAKAAPDVALVACNVCNVCDVGHCNCCNFNSGRGGGPSLLRADASAAAAPVPAPADGLRLLPASY